MPEISVGAAIGEGFALIRRAPAVVLIWGLTQVVALGLLIALLAPMYIGIFQAVQNAAASGDQAASAAAIQSPIMQAQGMSYLVDIVQFGLAAVLYCAAYRAVLHPEASRFAYLRLGMAELYLGALMFGALFAVGAIVFIAVIVVAVVVGVLIAVHLAPIAIVLGILAVLAAIGAGFYLALRFSLVGPMIVDDGKFHFEDAWRLTRGNVARLLLVGLALFAIAVAAGLILYTVFIAIGLAGLAVLAGGLSNLPVLFQQPGGALFARLSPFLVLAAIIWVPYAGCLNAIIVAPWARAYRDLKPVDVSATFS